MLSLSHLWWSHLKVYRYKSSLIFVLNEQMSFKILYHHNFRTTQAIFNPKRLTWSPECVRSQNVNITCRENAWDFKFANISCGEFCMFCSSCGLICEWKPQLVTTEPAIWVHYKWEHTSFTNEIIHCELHITSQKLYYCHFILWTLTDSLVISSVVVLLKFSLKVRRHAQYKNHH